MPAQFRSILRQRPQRKIHQQSFHSLLRIENISRSRLVVCKKHLELSRCRASQQRGKRRTFRSIQAKQTPHVCHIEYYALLPRFFLAHSDFFVASTIRTQGCTHFSFQCARLLLVASFSIQPTSYLGDTIFTESGHGRSHVFASRMFTRWNGALAHDRCLNQELLCVNASFYCNATEQ